VALAQVPNQSHAPLTWGTSIRAVVTLCRLQVNRRPFAKTGCGCGPIPWQAIGSGVGAQTSFNKGSGGHFASTDLFQGRGRSRSKKAWIPICHRLKVRFAIGRAEFSIFP